MAYVENLNGSYLFDTLYSEDAEGQKLNHMPGVEDLVNEYPLFNKFYLQINNCVQYLKGTNIVVFSISCNSVDKVRCSQELIF